jgi:hypothetical protein
LLFLSLRIGRELIGIKTITAYLCDVQDDEFMQRRLELLEGLSRGELAVFEGRSHTQNESKAKMSKWLK